MKDECLMLNYDKTSVIQLWSNLDENARMYENSLIFHLGEVHPI